MRRPLLLLAVLAGGCGGGARQDASEPAGAVKVEVVRATFPARQQLAQPVVLRLRVRNAGDAALANLAVTVETRPRAGAAPLAFGTQETGAGLSDPGRPVWVLDRGPEGGETAGPNTWTAGPLRAGEARELTWRLVAARAGTYTVAYRVAPGLTGRTRAASGARTGGSLRVTIGDAPVAARVGDAGQVIRGG